jgi:homoserine kinase
LRVLLRFNDRVFATDVPHTTIKVYHDPVETNATWKSAFAPATVANVGPGLDVLGFALDSESMLGDHCAIRLTAHDAIDVTVEGDGGLLPTEPDKNVASVAAMAAFKMANMTQGFELRLRKGIAVGSGLGSSAASAVSAVIAANHVLGNVLTTQQLIAAARQGEVVAAGAPHPDNVVPALLGGFQLMVDEPDEDLKVVSLPVPSGLHAVVVHPALSISTRDARDAVPAHVPIGDAIVNLAHLGMLISALYESDFDRLGASIRDRLHQPYRAPMIEGFDRVYEAAIQAGALGAGISGSGPSVFALTDAMDSARRCGSAMQAAFGSKQIASECFVSALGSKGAIQHAST